MDFFTSLYYHNVQKSICQLCKYQHIRPAMFVIVYKKGGCNLYNLLKNRYFFVTYSTFGKSTVFLCLFLCNPVFSCGISGNGLGCADGYIPTDCHIFPVESHREIIRKQNLGGRRELIISGPQRKTHIQTV